MLIAVLCALAADPGALPLPSRTPRWPRPAVPHPRLDTHAFRLSLGAGGHAASVRLAGVLDPTGPEIAELGWRGQLAWRHFGLSLEGAAGLAASESWSDAGLGNASLELYWIFGGRSTHTLGVRGLIDPVGRWSEPSGPIGWWGTVPTAMVPERGVALVYAGSVPRWVWRVELGYGDGSLGYGLPLAGAAVATVQPVAGAWSAVLEAEARLEPSPLHVRTLARAELRPGLELDVGPAFPLLAMAADPTLQLVAQLRGHW